MNKLIYIVIAIVIIVIAFFAYFFIFSNNKPIIAVTPESVYADSQKSVLFIQTNCLIEIEYPRPLFRYENLPAIGDVYINFETAEPVRSKIPIQLLGSSFKAEDKIFTNAHVIDCSNNTLPMFLTNYYLTPEEIEQIGILDIKNKSDMIWSMLKNNPKRAIKTQEDLTNAIAGLLTDYIFSHYTYLSSKIDNITITPTKAPEESFLAKTINRGEVWPGKDYAILNTESSNKNFDKIKNLKFGSSSNLNIGEKIYIIGYPIITEISSTSNFTPSFTPSLTTGVVSSFKTSEKGESYIQTDAASSGGNSGGPVFNNNGRVIGLLTAGSEGTFNFVFPSDNIPKIGIE